MIFLHGFSRRLRNDRLLSGDRSSSWRYRSKPFDAMGRESTPVDRCYAPASSASEAALEAIQHGEPDTIGDARAHTRSAAISSSTPSTKSASIAIPPRKFLLRIPVRIRSTGLNSKEFALRLLESQKVACVPGSAFGPSGEGFLRCCFATALNRIETAADRIARFVQAIR